MKSVIQQSVLLPATAEQLFEMYLTPKLHAAITGAEVTIGPAAGSEFRAFNGVLTGAVLAVVRPRLIVQSWRSAKFNDEDPDSTVIMTFAPEGNQARIDLVHVDVPEHDYDDARVGWDKYYWTPWKRYLERTS